MTQALKILNSLTKMHGHEFHHISSNRLDFKESTKRQLHKLGVVMGKGYVQRERVGQQTFH